MYGIYREKTSKIKEVYINAFNAIYETLVSQQKSLLQKFNEADYRYIFVSQCASEVGRTLNYVGKVIKPACKAERDQLYNQLQLPLDFNSKEANNETKTTYNPLKPQQGVNTAHFDKDITER